MHMPGRAAELLGAGRVANRTHSSDQSLLTATKASTSDASAELAASTRAQISDELVVLCALSGTMIVAPETTSGEERKNTATLVIRLEIPDG